MPKDITVTGAMGLIGRRVVRELVERGHRVTGLDRTLDSRARLLPRAIHESVIWIEGDTRDLERLRRATRSADSVIHLAAGASFLMYEEAPLEQTAGTIEGFHALLEASRLNDVETLVYASTSAVYEGNNLPYKETMELRPPDLKAFAKKVNEEMAALYAERYTLRPIGLRPFSVYGEDEVDKGKYANVASLFTWAICGGQRPVVWGDGTQTRDFIHVSDVARAFVIAAESVVSVPHLNVGTGVETSFLELLEIICSKVGADLDPLFVDIPISIYAKRLVADVRLSRQVLGFRPAVSLEDGVELLVDNVQRLLSDGNSVSLSTAQTLFKH